MFLFNISTENKAFIQKTQKPVFGISARHDSIISLDYFKIFLRYIYQSIKIDLMTNDQSQKTYQYYVCPTANGFFCIDPVTSPMNHKMISKTNYFFSKYDKNLDANRN